MIKKIFLKNLNQSMGIFWKHIFEHKQSVSKIFWIGYLFSLVHIKLNFFLVSWYLPTQQQRLQSFSDCQRWPYTKTNDSNRFRLQVLNHRHCFAHLLCQFFAVNDVCSFGSWYNLNVAAAVTISDFEEVLDSFGMFELKNTRIDLCFDRVIFWQNIIFLRNKNEK